MTMSMTGMAMPGVAMPSTTPAAPVVFTSATASPPATSQAGDAGNTDIAGSSASEGAMLQQLLPVLQGLVGVIGQLVTALSQAQQGARALGGGATACDNAGEPYTTPAPPASVPAAPGQTAAVSTATNTPATSTATASTNTSQVVVSGAAARPIIATRYVSGPAPVTGSLTDMLLNHASTMAPAAKDELGVWKWLVDPNGSGVYVHVHGELANQTNGQLLQDINNGSAMVHVHPDGSVHLHNM